VQAVRPLAASVRFVRVVASEILWQNVSQFKAGQTRFANKYRQRWFCFLGLPRSLLRSPA
jgi:hypothetical protein